MIHLLNSTPKTASRNVAFKARKLSDSIMESQDSFIMREFEDAEVYFGDDCEEIVADAGNNADLYATNQGSTELINETYTEEVPYTSWSTYINITLSNSNLQL